MPARDSLEPAREMWTRGEVKEVAAEAANEAVRMFAAVLAANIRKLARHQHGFITGHDAIYHGIANMLEQVDVEPEPYIRNVLLDDEHLAPTSRADDGPDSDGSGCVEDS